jgi:hypothetical protein
VPHHPVLQTTLQRSVIVQGIEAFIIVRQEGGLMLLVAGLSLGCSCYFSQMHAQTQK